MDGNQPKYISYFSTVPGTEYTFQNFNIAESYNGESVSRILHLTPRSIKRKRK